MIKEIEDFYRCLGRLEEAYQAECSSPQNYLAINEARVGVESAICKIETLLEQLPERGHRLDKNNE